jgi:hypothetical protein
MQERGLIIKLLIVGLSLLFFPNCTSTLVAGGVGAGVGAVVGYIVGKNYNIELKSPITVKKREEEIEE